MLAGRAYALAEPVGAPPVPHGASPCGHNPRPEAILESVPALVGLLFFTRVAPAGEPAAGWAASMPSMGIRMLHRRAAPPQADADGPTTQAFPPVPVFAAAASTARIPGGLTAAFRDTAVRLGRRVTDGRWRTGRTPAAQGTGTDQPPWRLWAELARAYLTLVLTLLPRPRPVRTVTVFVAASETLSVRPYGPAPAYPRPQGPPWPGPDAAP